MFYLYTQPSDGTCPCKAGYEDYGRGTDDCVPHIFPNCAEGSYRSQDGNCLSSSDWQSYCSSQVRYYVGVVCYYQIVWRPPGLKYIQLFKIFTPSYRGLVPLQR